MPYPRLHRDIPDLDAPPTFRLADFTREPGKRRARRPHDAELAVERVQECLDCLDELIDPLPFRRVEAEDDGPRAA
ncbi:MAG: hypothetical protein DYG94_00665 [Leptolyngbya sp. PLA3]|nr:MAG: hypothetical protein EDM82_01210 [Cyanobacteria bacterium CYA]MCE7967246.1 hypothetical protein [Leptolyngbya sp. PL-A3]